MIVLTFYVCSAAGMAFLVLELHSFEEIFSANVNTISYR